MLILCYVKIICRGTYTSWFLGAKYRSSLGPGRLFICLDKQPGLKKSHECQKICTGSDVKGEGVPEVRGQHCKSTTA